MSVAIVYSNSDGTVGVVYPNLACGLTLEQIAAKDVPRGAPYKIIDSAELPDITFRDAWEADTFTPDGTGADHGAGSFNAVTGWNPDGTPILRKESTCQ